MQNRKKIHEVLRKAKICYSLITADSEKKEDLINFFREAHSGQFNVSDYQNGEEVIKGWEWANLKNPNIYEKQFPAWVCKDRKNNRIVGHLGIMPVLLKFKNTYYRAAWGRDMIVTPSYRKTGICSLMFDSILKKTKAKLGLFLLAGLNDYAVSIYKKLGFIHLGYIPLYVRINNISGIIRNRLHNKVLAHLSEMLARSLLKILYLPSNVRGIKYSDSKELFITEIKNFDKSFDKLWENASSSFSIIVKRDSASLNWRFINQPYRKYRIFKAESKKNREIKGYVILREGESRGLRVGVVSDLFARADDIQAIGFLVNFAIKYFNQKSNIDLIRCDILHKNFAYVLKKLGFINIRSNSHFMVNNIHREMDPEFVVNRDNWFINYADCDLDLGERRQR